VSFGRWNVFLHPPNTTAPSLARTDCGYPSDFGTNIIQMASHNTSAITRELFQLKQRIDQLTFKQRRVSSPEQKDQLAMRIEGLKRTLRGLKHIRMLMLTASGIPKPSSGKQEVQHQEPAPMVQPQPPKEEEEKPPVLPAQQEVAMAPPETQAIMSKEEEEENEKLAADTVENSTAISNEAPKTDKRDLQLPGAKGLSIVHQIHHLRVAVHQHLQRYKPLQTLVKVFIAFWFLSALYVRA